jgi:hypothetical protein
MRFLISLALTGLITLGIAIGSLSQVTAEPVRGSARVDTEGTQFTVTMPDGRVLHSPDLVGAELRLRSGPWVRIDAVEKIEETPGSPLWLHTFSVQGADGAWTNLCRVGPDGRRAGFPVPGRASSDGTVAEAGPGVFELTCTGGAQAKCVRFGYRPWDVGPDGQTRRDLYNTCIRMVRADYGGDGRGTTRDGTLIDVYDFRGIQSPDPREDHDLEAGWGLDGAVCVRHVRIRENVSLGELERAYPRLRGRTGEVCTEEFARAHGAVLFNRSRP